MKYLITILVILGLNSCTSSGLESIGGGEMYTYKGMNFGSNRATAFKRGVVDGCATAAGDYQKDHTAYKVDEDYKIGWGDGRLKCYNINRKKDR